MKTITCDFCGKEFDSVDDRCKGQLELTCFLRGLSGDFGCHQEVDLCARCTTTTIREIEVKIGKGVKIGPAPIHKIRFYRLFMDKPHTGKFLGEGVNDGSQSKIIHYNAS